MSKSVWKQLIFITFFAFNFLFLSSLAFAADIIIDDEDAGYSETGAIFSEFNHSCGFNGDYRFETSGSTEFAEWVPVLPGAGQYRVYVHYCAHSARPDAAVYRIVADNGTTVVTVDQTKDAGGNSVPDFTASGWRLLGVFNMTPASGHKVEVDTTDPGDTVADAARFSPDVLVPTDYEKIQDAINAAPPTGRVLVDPGTYTDPIISCSGNSAMFCVSKSLEVIGDPGNSDPGPGPSAPIIDGGGSSAIAFVLSPGVSDVKISGFEIRNFANCCFTGGIGSAVMSWDTGATDVRIEDNKMHDLGWNGVLAGSDDDTIQSDWIVRRNIVFDAAYAGIELTNVINSEVRNNEVTVGSGISWDPSDSGVGIEIAVRDRVDGLSAGTVLVKDNIVNSDGVTGSVAGPRAGINILSRTYASSTGDSVLDSVKIEDNEVNGISTRGIFVTSETRHTGTATVSNLEIINNLLDGNGEGIVIHDFVNVVGTPTHDNIIITDNEITDSTGPSSGIHVLSTTSALEIFAHLNEIVGNVLHGINNEGTGTLDARFNWWGSITGPTHASNPGGTGDSVTNGVDFSFWLFKPFDPSDNVKPKVQQLILSDPSPVKAGTEMFTLIFNDDMNISFVPDVELKKGLKTYQVDPDPNVSYVDGWENIRTWHGIFDVDSSTGDGEYTVRISKARDIAGNEMSVNSSNKILIDTTSPVLFEAFAPDVFGTQDLTVSASAYDPGSSGISSVKVSIDSGPNQTMNFAFSERKRIGGKNVDLNTYFLTISGGTIGSGAHTALFSVFDGAGNEVDSSLDSFDKDSTSKTTGGTVAYLCKDNPESETVKNFDFGTKTSPLQSKYTRVTNATIYPTGFGYGWVSSAFGSVDRAVGDKLRRDLVFDSVSKEFKVNLPSDTYNVTILMGDMLFAHDDMSVTIEGTPNTNIDSNVGEIKVVTNVVPVTDGQLNIVFSDTGGTNADWVVNGIEISSEPICLDGIEEQTIKWMELQGWTVDFDKYSDWTLSSLLAHDLIVCSDESKACKPTAAVSSAHKFNNKPFVEIADSSNAKAAADFDYVRGSGGGRSRSSMNVFIERADSITNGFFGPTLILSESQRLTRISSSLESFVKDIASADDSNRGTNLFKVEDTGSQGRFGYIGWFFGTRTPTRFSGWTVEDLNSDGQLLVERFLNWAQCGNPTGCNP